LKDVIYYDILIIRTDCQDNNSQRRKASMDEQVPLVNEPDPDEEPKGREDEEDSPSNV